MWYKSVIIALSLMLPTQGCSQTSTTRQPAVAGAFYPADPIELKNQINGFLAKAKHEKIAEQIIGLMVPHAGLCLFGTSSGTGI